MWGRALIAKPQIPSPQERGCKTEGSEWKPVLTVLSQAQESCYELIHCGCKKGCTGQCKCLKASPKCRALCNCGGHWQEDDDQFLAASVRVQKLPYLPYVCLD